MVGDRDSGFVIREHNGRFESTSANYHGRINLVELMHSLDDDDVGNRRVGKSVGDHNHGLSLSIDLANSWVSMGLGGLGLLEFAGGSALSLDMDREGPAVDPRDPG